METRDESPEALKREAAPIYRQQSVTGQDLVNEAREWIGTKFGHCSSAKQISCDCVGLILGSARNIGLTDFQAPGYSPLIEPETLRRYLLAFCDVYGAAAVPRAGDIALLIFSGQAIHLGLCTGEGSLIHSWEKAGRVVEHPFDRFWREHTVGIYHWRGLDG